MFIARSEPDYNAIYNAERTKVALTPARGQQIRTLALADDEIRARAQANDVLGVHHLLHFKRTAVDNGEAPQELLPPEKWDARDKRLHAAMVDAGWPQSRIDKYFMVDQPGYVRFTETEPIVTQVLGHARILSLDEVQALMAA